MVSPLLLDAQGMRARGDGGLNHEVIKARVKLAAPVRMLSSRQRQ
jgi:hypothetical protein